MGNIFTRFTQLSVMARVGCYRKYKHRLTIIIGCECKTEAISLRLPAVSRQYCTD